MSKISWITGVNEAFSETWQWGFLMFLICYVSFLLSLSLSPLPPGSGSPGAPPPGRVWCRPVRPLSWPGGAALGAPCPLPLLPVVLLWSTACGGGSLPLLPWGVGGFGVRTLVSTDRCDTDAFKCERVPMADAMVAQAFISNHCAQVCSKEIVQFILLRFAW